MTQSDVELTGELAEFSDAPTPAFGGRDRSRFMKRLLGQPSTLAWATVLLIIVLAAIAAPLLTTNDPDTGDLFRSLESPSSEHWLGTDQLGRDVYTRVLFGARVALLAASEAVAVAVLIGLPVGLLIGYVGGRLDRIAMRFVEGVISMPFLVVALALISVLGPGLWKSMFAVGVIYATFMIRLARGQVLAAREELYVDAARVAGAGNRRILFGHILPNIMPPLIVQVTLLFATGIIVEATLSFLGLGVQPPTASLGSMLSDAQDAIRTNFFVAIPPGVMIFVAVLAFNQVGDGIRDLFGRAARGGSLGVRSIEPRPRSSSDAEPLAATTVGRDDPRSTSSGTPDDSLLQVRDLHVSFPDPNGVRVDVVGGVSFDVRRGEILGLVGESGSGKSVTAMSVLGIVPDPGRTSAATIRFDGHELVGLDFNGFRRLRGREIGVIFQDPLASLNPAFTVGDQVAEVMREHLGTSRGDARGRTVELFERVGIPRARERIGDYPHQFSGGMAQRVMIAMALSCGPKLLIADEPTTALDVTVQGQVLDLLLDLRADFDMSILLITHDLGVVAETTDRVAVMYAGELVEVGATAEVFRRPTHPYTDGLLKSVPRNEPRTGPLAAITGVVPSPWEWPAGCHFAARCPHAVERCRATPIGLVDQGDRSVRCVRAPELALDGAEVVH
jgi:peptide/nickel transport system permease protein